MAARGQPAPVRAVIPSFSRDWRYRCAQCGAYARLIGVSRYPHTRSEGDEVTLSYRTQVTHERACGCLAPVTCEPAGGCVCTARELLAHGCRCGGG